MQKTVPTPSITMITDFGSKDPFVGIMKGVILAINPAVRIIDLCHEIERHNVEEALYTLSYSYRYFPEGTIHLVVVDPGVGTERRPLLVESAKSCFLAPDNGVLSFLFARGEECVVRAITAKQYLRQPVSQTFHGRDIFAPAAAWLSMGVRPKKMGPEITDYQQLNIPQLLISEQGLRGEVIHVDRFGNLITNIQKKHLESLGTGGFVAEIRGNQIHQFYRSYAENKSDTAGMIINSFDLLEIFCFMRSAQEKTGIKRGDRVHVFLQETSVGSGSDGK
jgi:S-adenosylmethionine hydrolase